MNVIAQVFNAHSFKSYYVVRSCFNLFTVRLDLASDTIFNPQWSQSRITVANLYVKTTKVQLTTKAGEILVRLEPKLGVKGLSLRDHSEMDFEYFKKSSICVHIFSFHSIHHAVSGHLNFMIPWGKKTTLR